MTKEVFFQKRPSNLIKNTTIDIQNKNGLDYLKSIKNTLIDLVLIDPPYIMSK